VGRLASRHACGRFIVDISSIIGSKGGFGQANYAAAKADVHGLRGGGRRFPFARKRWP